MHESSRNTEPTLAALMSSNSSSFYDLISAHAPHLLPSSRVVPEGGFDAPHGTTTLALTFADGVIAAADRRVTQGNVIANSRYRKLFPADEHSAMMIAGSVGVAMEMVRLFQLELEHYEKIEGAVLSLFGKANRLSTMIRGNLGLAMQGLAAVPLLAGYDLDADLARIFTYDVTGGLTEEADFASTGSGSPYARASLKKLHAPDLDEAAAATVAIQALYDAAEDDSATGGPDSIRRIFPLIASVTAAGYRELDDDEVAGLAQAVLRQREAVPNGPRASVES